MIYGVVDVGSNTVRLCVYDVTDDGRKAKIIINRKSMAGSASYVVDGEMTREEALKELSQPPCSLEQQQADEAYILEKLDLSKEEWHKVLAAPPTPNSNYFSQQKLFDMVKTILGRKRLDKIRNKIYSVK